MSTSTTPYLTADEANTILKWINENIGELESRIAHYDKMKEIKGKMRFKGRYATYTHDVTVLRDFAESLKPLAIPTALEAMVNQMREVGMESNIIESVISEYIKIQNGSDSKAS